MINQLKLKYLLVLSSLCATFASYGENPKIKYISQKEFQQTIFDYKNEKEWKYKGDKPAIIDFYADWCAPCRQLAPKLEILQKTYGSELQVYKINTDKNKGVSKAFASQGIPALLFIPKEGKPTYLLGNQPMSKLQETIVAALKLKKKQPVK